MSTPTPTPQPLIDAIKAGMAARQVPLGDGGKPELVDERRPYVVAWFDAGRITNRSLRSRDGFSVVGVFHSVGRSPEAARIATTALRAVLLGLAGQTVGGWTVQTPSHDPALPLDRDDDANPPIWTQSDEWTFRLTPA